MVILNGLFRRFEECRIIEDESLCPKDLGFVFPERLPERHLVPCKLGFGSFNRLSESFFLFLRVIDLVVGHLRVTCLCKEKRPDGDTARHGDRVWTWRAPCG